jgi:hypothetical protein
MREAQNELRDVPNWIARERVPANLWDETPSTDRKAAVSFLNF